MRYRLRTLMILTAIGPPAISFVWHTWALLLLFMALVAAIAVWYLVAWFLARIFAEFVASLMG